MDRDESLISISGIVACHSCPRKYYFQQTLPGGVESERYTIAKQISAHLGSELFVPRIWSEAQSVAPYLGDEAMDMLADWVRACQKEEWEAPSETDVRISSKRYGISGMVDMLYPDDSFAIVRSTEAPEAGIYTSDRIRVACSLACIRESVNKNVEAGYVIYIPSGVIRRCSPEPRDRRAALRAIRLARSVNTDGEPPKIPRGASCETCYLKEEHCQPEPRRLSDIFR